MTKRLSDAKLRKFIRKIVKEEVSRALQLKDAEYPLEHYGPEEGPSPHEPFESTNRLVGRTDHNQNQDGPVAQSDPPYPHPGEPTEQYPEQHSPAHWPPPHWAPPGNPEFTGPPHDPKQNKRYQKRNRP